MATATVNYRAELSDLKKKLASITDITAAEARKMASDLNKSMRSVEKSNKKVANSFKDIGDTSGDAESSIRAISGAVGMLSPEAEKAMNVFAELGGATEGVTRGAEVLGVATLPALGTAVAAVSAAAIIGYAAWNAYTIEERLAEKAADQLSTALDSVAAASKRVTDAARDAARASGDLTDAEYAVARGSEAAAQARDRDIEALIKKSGFTKTQIENTRALISAEGDHSRALASMDQGLVMTAVHVNAINYAYDKQVGFIKKTATSTEDAKKTRDEEAAATRRQAKAQQHLAKVRAEELRLLQEQAAASDRLVQIQQSASLAVLEGEARVTEEYRRQLAQIDELERVSQDHEAAHAARAASRIEYEQEVAGIRERNAKVSADHEKRLIDEVARARQESMRQGLDITGQAFGAMAEGASRTYSLMIDEANRLQDYQASAAEHLTGSQQKELDRRVKAQKRAARNAFEAQKAAGAAAAAVQTAVAISTALASAPPPWNFALAGIAAAGGLAQQAAIMRQQPSFHKGGAVDMAPDEVAATVRKREFVLNPTGRDMLGDDTLKRANAGQRSGGGGEVVAVSVYKHTRQVDRWKRDGLSAGDPISRAITRGQLVGHRSNR